MSVVALTISGPTGRIRLAAVLDGSVALQGALWVLEEMVGPGLVVAVSDPAQLLCQMTNGAPLGAVVVNPTSVALESAQSDLAVLSAKLPMLAFGPPLPRADVAVLSRIGVRGYVAWDAPLGTFIDAVRVVCNNGTFLPEPAPGAVPRAAGRGPVGAATQSADRLSRHGLLAPRERQVVGWLVAGLTHKEIGRELGLSKVTIDTYVKRIRIKLEVGNKAELTRVAIRLGLYTEPLWPGRSAVEARNDAPDDPVPLSLGPTLPGVGGRRWG